MQTRVLFFVLLSTALLAYQQSRQGLQRAQQLRTAKDDPDLYTLPPAKFLKPLWLNHDEVAATMTWIRGLVYFGDMRLNHKDREPKHLGTYTLTISALDPEFFEVYHWYVSTFMNTRKPDVSATDIEEANRMLDRGIAQFPTRHELLTTAGLNYIGYSAKRPPRQRIEELTRGIAYLERAAQMEGSSDSIPFTVAWMYRRRRELQNKLAGKPVEDAAGKAHELRFFRELYVSTSDEQMRERIRKKLLSAGLSSREIAALDRRQFQRLARFHAQRYSYLPVDLWVLVAPTAEDDAYE